ncbi:TonB-dependent receptor [Sphingomonas sp. NSE70-1]|uniref:TonB-dependent receptor n=1 Tax=Sphingomonas caseinilyticus TaxID=2908205 RepID=A0ABT0RTM8_9SPHN|nr:TonB-dependent receptor [Sphingomonas caseinilyticus]MCL6698070.1 TonB-dependent receptor [Sphingomonas caseinilyticus]
MGPRFFREPVSLLVLGAAIAAQGAPVAAQDPPPQVEQTAAASAPETELALNPSPEAGQEVTDTIIVTGSRIPRPNLTAVSPVTVVGYDEVEFQGATMVEELLNRLPQVAPSQGAFISNGSTGTSTVDLRNLGAERTLVLVNGRRLAPGDAFSAEPDINIIPTTLLERVEILTGGASSVYGSDAIAGVVNFIMNTDLDGFRIDGQASVFQHDNRDEAGLGDALDAAGFVHPEGNRVDGGRQSIDLAYGTGFLDDRGHVTLYGGYRKTSELRQDARDYSACTADVEDDLETLRCGGSTVSYPGSFFTRFSLNGPLTIGPDRTFEPGLILFNFAPWNFYQRSGRRWTGGGFADVEISDAFKPYAEVMYMNDRTLAQIAPSGNFQDTRNINCDSPLLSDQQRSLVCFDGNFVGQNPVFDDDGNLVEIRGSPIPFTDPVSGATYFKGNLAVQRRAVETGGRQADIRHKNLRLVGGVKGDPVRGISYDASYVFQRAKSDTTQKNYLSATRLGRALDVVLDPSTGAPVCRSVLTGEDPACVPWDIFALGAVTPESTEYLSIPGSTAGEVKEQIANINATVELGEWGIQIPWADEAPSLNVGAEYRKDNLDYVPDEVTQSGDLAGAPMDPEVHGSTSVKELFAEARIPILTDRLVRRLAIEAGYRMSWYKAGDSSFSTSSYKVALDLTAVDGVRLRLSQQRAVRAPNIIELFSPTAEDAFFIDPCAGLSPDATVQECELTGLPASLYGQVLEVPPLGFFAYNSKIGGNLDLYEETARTRAAGLVLEPRFLPNFNATVDWWQIRLEDAVAKVDGDTIMGNCIGTGDPAFCERIHRDAEGSLWLSEEGFIDARNFNIGSIKIQGIDVGVNYRHDLGRIGTASLEFTGSYLDKFVIDNGGTSTPFDCAGHHGYGCFEPVPKWRHIARLTWEGRQGITVSASWRYTSKLTFRAYPDFDPIPPPEVPDQSFFDLATIFRVEPHYSLRLGVNNIFDREPPLVLFCNDATCNGNTFPQWYDPLGRYFFAGFTLNF